MMGREGKSGDWTIRIILHKTGRAAGLGRRTTKEMWEKRDNQRTALRFQTTGARHQTSPASLLGQQQQKTLPIRQTDQQTDRQTVIIRRVSRPRAKRGLFEEVDGRIILRDATPL